MVILVIFCKNLLYLKNGIFCEMVILVVFKVFLMVKNLEILIQIVPDSPIYYYFLAAFDKEKDSLNFLNFLNKRHPNIKFTIEKQINHSIAFLDVFISGTNNQNLTLQTSFSYKISLIKCLLDRLIKICNN